MRNRPLFCLGFVLSVALLVSMPSLASALTWYDYGINWEPEVGSDNLYDAATVAHDHQELLSGISATADQNGRAAYIYNDMQAASYVMYFHTHAAPGILALHHTTANCTALESESGVAGTGGTIEGHTITWAEKRVLNSLPTSSLRLAVFAGCETALAPAGRTTTLLTAAVNRRVDTAAGFNGTILINGGVFGVHTNQADFSHGFWETIAEEHASVDTSLDHGADVVAYWHLWNSGGYANHRRVGANPGF